MSLNKFYRSCAFPKSSRVVERLEKKRAADRLERKVREAVDVRDNHRCFFPQCKVRASDKHHVAARSLGGKWTTRNILSACRKHHDLFKAGLIRVTGNPDNGPVTVTLTALGKAAKIRVPERGQA